MCPKSLEEGFGMVGLIEDRDSLLQHKMPDDLNCQTVLFLILIVLFLSTMLWKVAQIIND
jgi:hypothetical protein